MKYDGERQPPAHHEEREILGTADLIFRLEEILLRHIVFKDKRYALLIAVWILGSSVFSVFTFFGYVWLNSPVKRYGKSLLLDILHELCLDATPRLNNASVATISELHTRKKIILLDESENMNGEDKARYAEIMTLLNAGFRLAGRFHDARRSTTIGSLHTLMPTVLSFWPASNPFPIP